jgi:hypothetical protein
LKGVEYGGREKISQYGKSTDDELKFVYSVKATKFCKISIVDLSYLLPVKSEVEILQNFVAFSEYMNFNDSLIFFSRLF